VQKYIKFSIENFIKLIKNVKLMRVAIASLGPDLNSLVSPSFGQAPYIIIVEVENGEIKNYEVYQNPGLITGKGKGVALAQFILSKNVDAVVAGQFGGNAYAILSQSGVKLFSSPPITVKEAAVKAEKGELPLGIQAGRRGWGWK